MALQTLQRFITGLTVFDTYTGKTGTISQMNLDLAATNPFAVPYVGPYFLVLFADTTTQLFTVSGNRIDMVTGVPTTGVTLLTQNEKITLMGVGYPATS